MEISTQEQVESRLKNPFPGLRPFRSEESHLFFGREDQVQDVIQKLNQANFVAVIGPSGIGKSSFIYCGLFPTLKAEGEEAVQILNLRPGDNPLENLAQALLEIKNESPDSSAEEESTESSLAAPRVLLFIDQFEELFRFQRLRPENEDEVEEFIQKILALTQEESRTQVVITMRSDFIGESSQYPNLTNKINESQFLIPYMTPEEKRLAITGPVGVAQGDIEESLVQRILNDIKDSPDQLPLMQHALMRTWEEWQKHPGRNSAMTIQHYENIGTIEKALSVHANDTYDELPPNQRNTCAKIFRAITEITKDGRKIRRPTKLHEIATVVNTDEAEVIDIIRHFRRQDRGLLMPPENEEVHSDSIIDISHESLIRIWDLLQAWVEEEAESVKIYLRLADDADKHQRGLASLWTDLDLVTGMDWWNKQKPTPEWGNRYHPTFKRTEAFLLASQKKAEEDEINRVYKQERNQRRNRVIVGIIALAALIAIIFAAFAWQQSEVAQKSAQAAKDSSIVAQKARVAAEESAVAARDSSEAARQARLAAESSARAARDSSEVARQARLEALKSAKIAELKRIEADSSANRAERAARLAAINQEIAAIETQLARLAEEAAYALRLNSIANSMAIKSTKLSDPIQQGLIAQQAYGFHIRSGGKTNDPDIYNGLYEALSKINGDGYNKLKGGHSSNVRAIVAQSNNKVYTAGSDGKIVLWNTVDNNNESERFFVNTQNKVEGKASGLIHRSLAYNGKWLAATGNYPNVLLFPDGNLKSNPIKVDLPEESVGQIWYSTFLANDQLAIVDENGNIYSIDPGTKKAQPLDAATEPRNISALMGAEGKVYYVIDHQIFIAGESGAFYTHSEAIISMAYSPVTKNIALGCASGKLYVFPLGSQESGGAFINGHSTRINQLDFDASGQRLASASFDKTVRIWDVNNRDAPPIILKDHNDWVWSIAFSGSDKNSKLVAGCRDKLLRAWPTQVETMTKEMCDALARKGAQQNISRKDWERFVSPYEKNKKTGELSNSVPYELTCPDLGLGEGLKESKKDGKIIYVPESSQDPK